MSLKLLKNCPYPECERPVENEETGLCAYHGHQERKGARKAAKPKKAYKIPAKSKKGKEKDKRVKLAYNNMKLPKHCGNCGSNFGLTHSHIIPQGQYPEFSDVVENIVYDCIRCHTIWEHGTWEEVQSLQDLPIRLAICLKLCEQFVYRRFLLKNLHLTMCDIRVIAEKA